MAFENLSIVLPVHFEGENILKVLDHIERYAGRQAEILLCYDLDDDPTLSAVQPHRARFPRLRWIKNHFGRGPLGAIKSGFKEAAGEAILVMMADLSDDLSCLPRLMELFEQEFSIIAPSRYMKGGKQVGGPLLKRIGSRFAGLSLYYLAKLPVHDATNNFKLYSRKFLRDVVIESTGGFELAIELTVKARHAGLKIAEIPTTWTDRVSGKSKFKILKWLPKYLRWYFYAFTHR